MAYVHIKYRENWPTGSKLKRIRARPHAHTHTHTQCGETISQLLSCMLKETHNFCVRKTLPVSESPEGVAGKVKGP